VVIKKCSAAYTQLSEAERVQLKKSSLELVVAVKWVGFWRWQSKVIEKK
jgi:hypothetical protein